VGIPPAQRGRTDIADRVVEKIAVRLTEEVDGVVRDAPRGWLDTLSGQRNSSATSAKAVVGRTAVRLSVTLDVRYPMPVGEVSDRVRAHLAAGVGRLTGLAATEIDLTVRHLVPARDTRRRVE
jgi:uncharacterized alkaline shock family protein YloU